MTPSSATALHPPAQRRTAGELRVGTSGWAYRHWRGPLYPPGLASRDWLAAYAERFDTVEVNGTFYRLPTERTVAHWRDAVPASFRFSVKASRLITHARRLRDASQATERFLERILPLGDRLACILWQLPPGFVPEIELLDRFLSGLPVGVEHAVELRGLERSPGPLLELLAAHGVAYACTSSARVAVDCHVTAPFVYVRLHGLAGGYAHAYSEAELRPWVEMLRHETANGHDAFVYFNNDADAHAPVDAALLRSLVMPAGDA